MDLSVFRDRKLWGIFLLSMGTLLYEVVLTSIFSYTVWSNYAFMIVSTALFGFGVAGVFLFVFKGLASSNNHEKKVSAFSFCFALMAVISLFVIMWTPLDVSRFDQPVTWGYLAIIFLSIMAPFFFSGLAISILLATDKRKVNRLYFFDLVGASIGSLLIVLLLTPLGAPGVLLLSSLLGVLAAMIFSGGKGSAKRRSILCGVIVVILVLIPFSEHIFRIYPHQNKRNFIKHIRKETVFFSGWSPLSKIDVIGRRTKDNIVAQIWINGGQNQSFLAVLGPKEVDIKRPDWGESINFPYMFMRNKRPKVMIIGSSGGMEVVYALSHRSRYIDAVEMDPLICRIVKDDFKQYNKGLFYKKGVHLRNDEGRSFILNTKAQKYDLIQMKNNFTPIAIASGSINLSETYLLTVEGFKNYITHLTTNGILALNRWGSIRLCTTLRKAYEELGRKNVGDHVAILTGETWMLNGFYYKNTPFSPEEIGWIKEYAKAKHFKLLYHPGMAKDENLYAKVLNGNHPEVFYHYAGFELTPPTDDKPFFNHFVKMGTLIDIDNPLMLPELKKIYQLFALKTKKSGRVLTKSDLPVFSLAIESIVMSLFFIFIPLIWVGKRDKGGYRKWPFIYYFTILGVGFIMIELCLMKQFVLFLGYPALSISLIIAILLFFTGVGSFIAERFQKRIKPSLKLVFILIFFVNMGLMFFIPRVFSMFLGSPFAIKAFVTVLLLFPLGIVMGMPFPLGLVLVHERSKNLVGWVWGINGFATVVGSVLTVLMALYLGFSSVLVFASILYLSALLVLKEM